MEIKNLSNTYAYVHKVETNLKEIGKLVGNAPAKLIEQASREGFKIAGPQFWNYNGMDGDPNTVFQLEIAIPVEESKELKSENAMAVPGFRCVTRIVKGPWSNLGPAYEALVAEMNGEGLKPGRYCREIYHDVDFENQENNVTEIQMSIN